MALKAEIWRRLIAENAVYFQCQFSRPPSREVTQFESSHPTAGKLSRLLGIQTPLAYRWDGAGGCSRAVNCARLVSASNCRLRGSSG